MGVSRLNSTISWVGAIGLVVMTTACSSGFSAQSSSMEDGLGSGGITQPDSGPLTAAQLIEKLREKSCVFDSLVAPAVEDEADYIRMLSASACESVPRAIETWMKPPDFTFAVNQIAQIKAAAGRDFSYGMFIAEAIDTTAVYPNRAGGGNFNFANMCVAGSQGFWGANSCIPAFSSSEYRNYVKQIVSDALDIGVQDILFGQVDMMDSTRTQSASLVADLRAIAAAKGIPILIGSQPGASREASFLKLFDYIIGPSRMAPSGEFFLGAKCRATQLHPQLCGDLKWDPAMDYLANANNVIMEFDWYYNDDDIHRFARLTREGRARALIEARHKFIRKPALGSAGMGMIMPFRIPLNGGLSRNGITSGCHGYNEYVYSPSSTYGCQDEATINSLLKGQSPGVPDSRTPAEVIADNLILNLYGVILERSPLSETPADTAGFNYWTGAIVGGQKTCTQAIDDFVYTYNQAHPSAAKSSATYLALCQ